MGYYIRVLGTKVDAIPIDLMRSAAEPAVIKIEKQSREANWTQVVLSHADGQEIALIERNDVVSGELGAEEIQELMEEVQQYKPASAVAWLREFLPRVRVIYAFQLLSGTDVNDGWTSLHALYSKIWNRAGGILQADGEGFSDEDGYTILWQFSEDATGEWNVGTRRPDGGFVHYAIELGNPKHRSAFLEGEIPKGVKLA
ncbi:hypothetical protein Acid345_2240 [Candidatus Koribacter versatilis Ellin345]|uniref:Uncharacterized protein n=1 Tax=Koribacter versatilis (strain Ellin345) TaxID=204669 RepID=Q1IPF9_KORVE|nr:hypothetical protein [Candidatus Koribacter versatilis]ABF41241.1 hypothetical protein Acid345_2240 [Candidatus Koribacter versatilis Ellin345]